MEEKKGALVWVIWEFGAPLHTWEGLLHKCLEGLQVVLLLAVGFGQQGVPAAELALQVLRAAQAFELPVHHDGQAGTEGFTLLHAVEKGIKAAVR